MIFAAILLGGPHWLIIPAYNPSAQISVTLHPGEGFDLDCWRPRGAHWTIEYDSRVIERVGTIRQLSFKAKQPGSTTLRGWFAVGNEKPIREFTVMVTVKAKEVDE